MTKSRIFISYSRIDTELVAPITALLRISTTVFRDEDSIRPGKRWANEIEKSVRTCTTVIVFWSRAASESKYVEEEILSAAKHEKDIVPVLLDDTPLPDPLSNYQWLDFRPFIGCAALRGIRGSDAGFLPGTMSFPMIPIPLLGSLISGSLLAFIYTKQALERRIPIRFRENEEEEMRALFSNRLEQKEK